MKNEIEKILDDTLRSYDEIEDIPEAADQIISSFTNLLDSCEDEISDYLYGFMKLRYSSNIIKQDILQIIKSKLKENNNAKR